MTQWGIAGKFYGFVCEGSKGNPLAICPMHPAVTEVRATKNGKITAYITRSPAGDEMKCDADEVRPDSSGKDPLGGAEGDESDTRDAPSKDEQKSDTDAGTAGQAEEAA